MRFAALLLVLPLTLCAVQHQAFAQSDELAQGHYMAGQAYYKQARYLEAIREFEEAYRLSNKAPLLFNIAQAYERMGMLDKTVEYLKRYLEHPGAKDRGSVRERLRNLEARLAQTGIKLQSEVEGATVLVDGKEVGKTPLAGAILLSSGSHEIRVTKEGYEDFSAYASVAAGNLVQIEARLKPLASKTAPQPPSVPASATVVTSPEPQAEREGGRLWTWIVGGTSAALLLTGAVTGGLALKKTNEANDALGSDAHDDLAQSSKNLALISDITLGVGIGAAVAAVVLYFFEGREEPRRTALIPLAGPSTAGLGMQLTF